MRGTFRGSYVALPTPFRDGHIDFNGFRALVEFQIENGTDGLVIAGTTGEAATLSEGERTSLIEYGTHLIRGRVPVLAGVGTNDTRTTCLFANAAASAGADGLLAVTPFYNKPTQRGLVEHYAKLADATPLPVVLYNVPSRTSVDLKPETIGEIAKRCENVIAVKEASGSLDRIKDLIARDEVDVLCGEDGLTADCILLGGIGVVGVVANVAPRAVAELVHCCLPGGDPDRGPAIIENLRPLIEALFLETNPAPVKAALAKLGLCGEELRLPLVPIEDATRERLLRAMVLAGLIVA